MNPETTIGGYKLFRLLGEGAAGRVYDAFDTRSQGRAAVKLIRPELTRVPQLLERMRVHSITPPRLEHANINRLRNVFCSGDQIAIAMDWVTGETLDRYLARTGPLPACQILPGFLDVLHAFEAAHRRRFLHCDIKAGNVIFSANGSIQVMDFCLSRILGISPLTAGVLGSRDYVSPEQLAGDELNERSDIYSLGVVLYQLVTGVLPPYGDAVRPAELEPVILRALAPAGDQRFASAAEFRDALSACKFEAGRTVMSSAAPVAPVTAPHRAKLPKRSIALVAGAATLCSIAWLALKGHATRPAQAASHRNAPGHSALRTTAKQIPPAASIPEDSGTTAAPDVEPEFRPPPMVNPARLKSPALPAPPEIPALPLDNPLEAAWVLPDLSGPPVSAAPAFTPKPPAPPATTDAASKPAAEPEQGVPLRVAPELQEARRVGGNQPLYPPLARQMHVTGMVRLEATISKEGKVVSVVPLAGHALLIDAALQAVKTWRYRPVFINSRPVPVVTKIDIVFSATSRFD